MNTRVKYTRMRMSKKPVKKVPKWLIEKVREEARQIAKLYGI